MKLLHRAVFGHSLCHTWPSRAIGASAPCAVRCAAQPHSSPLRATGSTINQNKQHSWQATTQQHRPHPLQGQQAGLGKERAYTERANRPIVLLEWRRKTATPWEALRLELQTRTERQWLAEYHFDAVRKWRIDLACPRLKIGIEIDGGVWLPHSGHAKPQRILKNMEKRNALAASGWRVLVYTPQQVQKPEVRAAIIALTQKELGKKQKRGNENENEKS